MAKKPSITTLTSGFNSTTTLNNNFTALRNAFDNTLSLDGSTPNAMNADFDMNGNNILNANSIETEGLSIGGVQVGSSDLTPATALFSTEHTGNGSTTTFSMTYNPGVEFNTYVFVDGVYQNKSTYTISGTNVIFSEAPPLNSKIELNVFRALTLAETVQASNVSYTATGASALRTVQTKLEEFVSVKDFGAVGNGVTNDTAAFNAAWAATNPQAVYVPAASYVITGTVTGKFFSFGVVTVVGGTVTTITNLVP